MGSGKSYSIVSIKVMFMPSLLLIVLFLILGLIIGTIMSLIGASGVMIIVPALNIIMGYSMSTAIGISLFVDVLASLTVGFVYFTKDRVDLRNAIWVSLGAIMGARMGAGVSPNFSEWFLGVSYTIWMLSAGVAIWKKGKDRKNIAENFLKLINVKTGFHKLIFSVILGFVIGVNAGVFGASSGPLFMLVLVFIMGYPISKAIGTSTIIMMITALSALTEYWRMGSIDLEAGVIITLGTMISGVLGVQLAVSTDDKIISKIVGFIFILLGIFQAIYWLL
jgi:uncharacterized membrane protein YfcA